MRLATTHDSPASTHVIPTLTKLETNGHGFQEFRRLGSLLLPAPGDSHPRMQLDLPTDSPTTHRYISDPITHTRGGLGGNARGGKDRARERGSAQHLDRKPFSEHPRGERRRRRRECVGVYAYGHGYFSVVYVCVHT